MCKVQKLNHPCPRRRNERGAALISVLLISTLLMTAGGVLLLTTSMSATAPLDATAEMQAYYAAEAGLQRTLNVMRTNDIPAGTMPAGKTELTFRDVTLNPKLTNWIPFNGPTLGGAQTTLVGTNAFSVSITDPDDQNPLQALRKINTNPNYQPSRLKIQLTGYGPKRAKKILNMIVIRGGLAGFQAPATITLLGSALPLPALTFNT
ncbi:MAG: pilus assembly PilX N-terminal domain-containing protein, partial [Acidobacteria bacterium]|nr:pilus assembly PilX N-terminal domain-containing protein [Acidobacteriota bacterium]